MTERLVVVGNGLAGVRAVEEILARGGVRCFTVTVFGEESCGHYDRSSLPELLSNPDCFDAPFAARAGWYRENGIELQAGVSVTHIHPRARCISDSLGRTTRYDKLIIATGSSAYIPPIRDIIGPMGGLRANVFAFRSLADARAVREAAKSSKRALVVGGGPTGVDVARGLAGLGCEVDLVELAPWLLNRQLDAGASAILQRRLEESGIRVHLSKSTERILGDGRVSGVGFRDGSSLECDLVVIAAGTVPNTWLSFQAGLRVERAIVVDNHMRAVDDPHVFAVGECAQHRGKIYGGQAALAEQCAVLADHLTNAGAGSAYFGSKDAMRMRVVGLELASLGEPRVDRFRDEVLLHSEPQSGKYQKLVIRKGRLVGAILLGRCGKIDDLSAAFQSGEVLPREHLSLLADAS